MSTVSQPTTEPLAVGAWADDGEADSKSERYLARRLAAASADYKGVAITTFLLGAGVGAIGWVSCGVVLEHWLVSGGLPRWARWTWLLMGLAAFAAAAIRWILPLVRYRVNLVYAARAIEREHPELHNDIVNTVLVKAHPEGNAATIVKSLERRAAKRLSSVPAENVIDRSLAVRLAYALALLVGLACVYSLAAPKSMLTTTARLLAPWTRLVAPTRVRLEPARLSWRMPGEEPVRGAVAADGDASADGSDPHDPRSIKVAAEGATLVRGRQLVVSSVIRGLRPDERPMIAVTPLLDSGAVDGAAVPWRIEMTRAGSDALQGQRYAVVLPDAARGLDQSVAFTIQAGDARSELIRVTLVDAPTLLVRKVRYEFPAYMQRENETVAWQGDLRAVEGTRVVISAESNQPIEAAWIDFECDGSRDLKLKVGASDLAKATVSFVMQMNPERTAAEHASYRLLFQPRGAALTGREQVETEKLEHRIEVQADLAPEISVEEPRESPISVPPGAPVTVRVRALDPDFGLARVGIETRVQGGAVQPEIVLPGSERRGAFSGAVQLVPERLGAGQGSRLEYRGVAVDTRPGQPNITQTPWKVLQIDASAPPRPAEKMPPRSGEQKQRDRDEAAGDATEKSQGDGGDSIDPANDRAGDTGEESRSDGADAQGKTDVGDQQGDQNDQGNRQGEESADGQQGQSSGEEPAGVQPDAKSAQSSDKQSRQKNSQQQSPQQRQNDSPQNSDQQGEPQPGQQNGTASGSQQGGKQPQAGDEDKQRGSTQGQGGEAGGEKPSGKGSGAAGKSGSGTQPDGEQADGKQGNGGQPAAAKQSGDDRPGSGNAENRDSGGKSQGRQGQRDGQRQQEGGKQGSGQQQPRSAVASDGTNDGEAMERILDHRRQAGGQSTSGAGDEKAGKPPAGKPEADAERNEQQGDSKKPGDKKPGDKNPGDKNPGDKNPKKASESQPCAGSDGKPCGKEGCSSCGGGGKTADGKAGNGSSGKAEGQQGQGQQGQGQQGQGQQGQGQQGQGQQGQGQQGQGQQGQGEEDAAGGSSEDKSSADKGQQKSGKPAAGPAGEGGAQLQGDPKQEGKAGGKPSGQQAVGPPPEGARESSPVGGGGWSEGAAVPQPGSPAAQGPPPSRETEWEQQDLENARNAADLAIEHLRTTVESGRTDVLDELGWTRDQARAFLDRWETMRRQSESPDPQKRGDFERVLRSLGLRPAGVQSSRDVPADAKGGQAEGRRSRPPSDYRERFKAFLQGTSGEQAVGAEQGSSANQDARGQ